jgi:hypothetical protein
MKVSVIPFSETEKAKNLSPNTIVKFPNNSAYFVIPGDYDLPGIWISGSGTTHGAIDPWKDSRYYDSTNYTIVGTLKIEI